jgi:hypothetical protein
MGTLGNEKLKRKGKNSVVEAVAAPLAIKVEALKRRAPQPRLHILWL